MYQLVALFAQCMLYPPPDDPCQEPREVQYEFLRNHAQEVAWNDNGTVRSMKLTGIVVPGGIESFHAGRPAPELLEKIGPALLAAGTEELRVWNVSKHTPRADPTRPPTWTASFQQFIRGREVRGSWVGISVDIETNEVTRVTATFLPDRGVDHLPRLSPGQAKAKARATMRESVDKYLGSEERELSFSDTPAYLAYEFEKLDGFGGVRGVLVWIFSAQDVNSHGWYQVSVDAATGKVVSIWTTWVALTELQESG